MYLVPLVLKMSAQILDEEGNPIPDVTYAVSADGYFSPVAWMSTDSEGMIYLENLPDSEISIIVIRYGYQQNWWTGLAGSHVEIVLQKE